jgi:hypothetical protein
MTEAPNPSSKGAEDLRKFLKPVSTKTAMVLVASTFPTQGTTFIFIGYGAASLLITGDNTIAKTTGITTFFSTSLKMFWKRSKNGRRGRLHGLGTGLGFLSRLLNNVCKRFQNSLPHRLQDYSVCSTKKSFFTPCKIWSTNFESSWLKTFVLHKVEVFGIMLGN